ncbi:MAG TPA: hypothetical protein VF711_13955, partial [Acidimicrobiales bacterium]
MTDGTPTPEETQRCPACQRLNRVPAHDAGEARCGACGATLTGVPAPRTPPPAGDLRRVVIERWDALVRYVPPNTALSRAVGRGGAHDPAGDPVGWLSNATLMPRDDLDQLRLLRVHLASNKTVPTQVLTRALDTLERAHATIR